MKNLVVLIFLISTVSFGQNSGFGQAPSLGVAPGVPASFRFPNNFYDTNRVAPNGRTNTLIVRRRNAMVEIVNSPFLEDEYQEGETTIHGKPGFKAKMRYNAGKDVIEFIDEDHTAKELLRRPYITAKFDGKEYVILKYKVVHNNIEKLGYFNPLNKGVAQLLLMPKKKLELTGYSFQERRSGVYKDVSVHFIKLGDKPAVNINLSTSNIFKLLDPTYENVLKYFVSENSLNLRKKEDVIRLLQYYNTLASKNTPQEQMRS